MRMTALATLGCLAAISATSVHAEGGRQITGSVTYLARIALPPEAVLLVEARSDDGASLAHQVIPTAGAQVPLAYALEIPVSQSARLTASIVLENGTRWALDPVVIEPDNKPLDLGEKVLHAFSGVGLDMAYLCGADRIGARFGAEGLLVDAKVPHYPQIWDLARDAEGKFVSADGTLSARLDGTSLILSQDGTDWPACAPVPAAETAAWQASGEGWGAAFKDGQITLRQGEAEAAARPLPTPEISARAVHYALADNGAAPLVLSVTDQRCTAASGLVYPQTTTLLSGEASLAGCGGDPRSLLNEAGWKVEAIRGEPVLSEVVPTLTFTADNALFGMASCNRYSGGYTITETGLSVGQLIATMMACPEPMMEQEKKFHDALSEVTGFAFGDDGALILKAGETELLRARKG